MSEPELGVPRDPGRVVSNAGPLITLATMGKLDLLKGLFAQVYIPEAVYDEVVVRGQGEPGSREEAAEKPLFQAVGQRAYHCIQARCIGTYQLQYVDGNHISSKGTFSALSEVDAAEWIETCAVEDRFSVSLLRDELDAGESEAIVLAQELGARYVLLDDRLARRKTMRLGLSTTGTLGVLLMSKEAGLIAQVKPILDELRKTDFRMSSAVYREVLVKAHEKS